MNSEATPVARRLADSSTVEPSIRRSRRRTARKSDYDPEREVAEDIGVITGLCDAWKDADKMASGAGETVQKACRVALAEIFVRSGPTDEDPEKRAVLIARVQSHDEVAESKRYRPADQTAAELHLTLQFGLKSRRSAKSNWKTVLDAAEIQLQQGMIAARSLSAFSSWFDEEGMRGARKVIAVASGKADTKKAAIEAMRGLEFELPEVWTCDEEIAPGRALLLIEVLEQGTRSRPAAEALGIIRNEAMCEAAAVAILRAEKAIAKANEAMAMEELENRDTPPFSKDLLIPKSRRRHFDGRTHYEHEDERKEYELDLKLEREHAKKARAGKRPRKSPQEHARGSKRKTKLPLDQLTEDPAPEQPAIPPAAETGNEAVSAGEEDDFDAEAFFARALGAEGDA